MPFVCRPAIFGALATLLATTPPPRADVYIHLFFADSERVGHQGTSTDTWATIQDGAKLYRFNPASPTDPMLEVRTVPPPQEGARAVWVGDALYIARQQRIARMPKQGPAKTDWFVPESTFQTFQILDDQRVALVWTAPKDLGEAPYLVHAHAPEVLESRGVSLVELWEPDTGTCLHREPLPQALLEVLRLCQPLQLGSVLTYRSQDDLLILIPLLGHLYHFEVAHRKLTKVDTPWPSVEAPRLQQFIQRAKPGTRFLIDPMFYATSYRAFPTEGGGLVFSYGKFALRTDTVGRLSDGIGAGRLQILPGPPDPDATGDPLWTYQAATWDPAKHVLKPLKLEGPANVQDPKDPRLIQWNNDLQAWGLAVDAQQQPIPAKAFIRSLDKALERRAEVVPEAKPTAKNEDMAGRKGAQGGASQPR